MMNNWDQDRLVSASEIERWSYCPLSWLLERNEANEVTGPLDEGIVNHERIGSDITKVQKKEGETRNTSKITIAFLSFAFLLISMSLLLLLLTNVGFLKETVWRVAVIFSSALLIFITITFYIFRTGQTRSKPREKVKEFMRWMEESRSIKGYFPMLSYFFGMILLLNGIVLLRPLDIAYDVVVTVFTMSLLFMYGALMSVIIFIFYDSRKKGIKRKMNLGIPLSILLLISMSVLFILASDRLDPDGWFGWMFLILSLLWFIGALFYDLIKRRPRSKKKKDSDDLPIATIALVASVFTAMAFLARGDNLENYNTLTILMAIIWVIGAVFFFIKGTSDRRKVRKRKKELDIPEKAKIVQVDDIKDSNRGKPMVSKKHFLIGSPDILIEENGSKVPVEIKTGRAPQNPYFSHIMQLSAYLVLVDATYNQNTTHGYIEYAPRNGSKKRHKVEWDMLTKAHVLSKVSEIRDAERSGVAHRNHNREGKCRSCSRRTDCPERLV